MSSPLLADAFRHHVWATIRLLDTCAALDEEQLGTAVPGTYGSIIDTLRHLVDGDVFYPRGRPLLHDRIDASVLLSRLVTDEGLRRTRASHTPRGRRSSS